MVRGFGRPLTVRLFGGREVDLHPTLKVLNNERRRVVAQLFGSRGLVYRKVVHAEAGCLHCHLPCSCVCTGLLAQKTEENKGKR